MEKKYDHERIESKWSREWGGSEIYKFDTDRLNRTYSIDTPPAYPTGNFHMGNALNWIYFDIVARYKRMKGFNVMFPQGWDCHGLPTEVQVEKKHGIKKGDVPREEFRRLCIDLTEENIEKMEGDMMKLGLSIDWNLEYSTFDPDYWRRTQISFIRLYKKGLIYRGEHPIEWCPRCRTAIAHAEVEYEEKEGSLNYIIFEKDEGNVEIATTRPELLCSCVAVAVNPDDHRYTSLVGKGLKVPLYENEVEVIADSEVDQSFGTGVVMICTFGDREDVKWTKRHDLPVIQAIDEDGMMREEAGRYAGMSIEECKEAIIDDLDRAGKIVKREKLTQKVGTCWRCGTPVEILSHTQWFMDVRSWKEEIIDAADKVNWIPDHMKSRLQNWADTMEWDWVISRQRLFATPIPVWYCKDCNEIIIADEDLIPLDPTMDDPPVKCGRCGCTQFEPEKDVLDTWMDSSITCAVHSGWPDVDSELFKATFPADLQPNGTDIIRTWDYYLLVRHLALLGEIPYRTVLINGMVMGEDGRKMSKSLGNYVMPDEVIKKYGADSVRQWAVMGGSVGSDVIFSWKDIVSASRFLQKLWSILRFSSMHMEYPHNPLDLTIEDRWLLSRLNRLVRDTTDKMEEFKFDEALKRIRTFSWGILADEYLELVKWRLYGEEDERKKSARYTLYITIETLSRLLAPFIPFFAEEMYSHIRDQSVHLAEWPKVDESLIDQEAEVEGEIISRIISAIRRYKSDKGIALNAPLRKIEIYAREKIEIASIAGAMNTEVEFIRGDPKFERIPIEIRPNMSVIGPLYKNKAKRIADTIEKLDPKEIGGEKIKISVDGNEIELDRSYVEIEYETKSKGEEVEIIDVDEVTIVIFNYSSRQR